MTDDQLLLLLLNNYGLIVNTSVFEASLCTAAQLGGDQ